MPTDSQRIALAVARINRRLRQERRSELTPSQLSVLSTLVQLGQAPPSLIAARERVSAPSITRTLNSLDELSLIERDANPDDGRQVLVSISKLGEKVLAEERVRRDEWLQGRLRALENRERAVLREAAALLERLADS